MSAIPRYRLNCPGPDEFGCCEIEETVEEDGRWMDAETVLMYMEMDAERIAYLEQELWLAQRKGD